MKKPIPIETVRNLSQEVFDNDYFLGNKPLIIKDGLKNMKIYEKWTPAYLKKVVGARRLNVDFSNTGIYNYNQNVRTMSLPFDQIVDLFISGTGSKGLCYLAQTSIAEHFPEIVDDLETPPWIKRSSDLINSVNLWFGCEGCVAPLHIDEGQNFLMQVMGTKKLTLFAPSDSKYLYLDREGKRNNVSKVDVENIDYDKFPLVANAQPYYGTLDEGDILYMPPLWWHHIRSLTPAISVNYWWHRFELLPDDILKEGTVERFKSLISPFIKAGINIDLPGICREPMLIMAVKKGELSLAEALLALGADPNSKTLSDDKSTPVLNLAIEEDNQPLVELLLQYDADKDLTDSEGLTAIDTAKRLNHLQTVRILENQIPVRQRI